MPNVEKRVGNIYIIWVPEIDMEKNGSKVVFEESMAENFLKLMEDIKPHIPQALQIQSKINTKKTSSKYILVKLTKKYWKEKRSGIV